MFSLSLFLFHEENGGNRSTHDLSLLEAYTDTQRHEHIHPIGRDTSFLLLVNPLDPFPPPLTPLSPLHSPFSCRHPPAASLLLLLHQEIFSFFPVADALRNGMEPLFIGYKSLITYNREEEQGEAGTCRRLPERAGESAGIRKGVFKEIKLFFSFFSQRVLPLQVHRKTKLPFPPSSSLLFIVGITLLHSCISVGDASLVISISSERVEGNGLPGWCAE